MKTTSTIAGGLVAASLLFGTATLAGCGGGGGTSVTNLLCDRRVYRGRTLVAAPDELHSPVLMLDSRHAGVIDRFRASSGLLLEAVKS